MNDPKANTEAPRGKLRAHLGLLRLPLAATTVADIWAGYLGARAYWALDPSYGTPPPLGSAPPVSVPDLVLLHLAAIALYGAGMTLNDAFDHKRDRELHPERPIPAGLVSVRGAALQGALLLAGGVGLAILAGPVHGALAGGIAALILVYNGLAKRWTAPGALAMGAIRYLDVQLGAGLVLGWLFPPAVVLGVYIVVVTFISTLEETPKLGAVLRGALFAVVTWLAFAGKQYPHYLLSVWFYGGLACAITFYGMRAHRDQTRAGMQRLTLALLIGIFCVDGGALAGLGRPWWGLGALALAASSPLIKVLLAPRRVTGAETATRRTHT